MCGRLYRANGAGRVTDASNSKKRPYKRETRRTIQKTTEQSGTWKIAGIYTSGHLDTRHVVISIQCVLQKLG